MRRAWIVVLVAAGCGGPARVVEPGPGSGARMAPSTSDAGVETTVSDGGASVAMIADLPLPLILDEIDPALLGDGGHQAGLEPVVARAKVALAARQWDKAIAQARAALAIDPEEPRAVAALVRALIGKSWWDSARIALAGLDDPKRKLSTDGELWYLAGWTSAHLGEPDRALTELGKAVKLRKDDAAAWNLMGVVHLERAEIPEAVTALENARTHAADSIAVLTNLGSAYRRQARTAEGDERDELLRRAETSYQSAIRGGIGRASGGYAPAYLGLGLLYLDARTFPGLDDVQRLQAAVTNLTESDAAADGDVDPALIDRDLSQARRDLERARREADKTRGTAR